jgi:hypothetical protein
MKKVNKINQFDQLDIKDVRWYSSIKNKIEALEQGYGTVEVILKIKSHNVVAIDYISKGSENIG